MANLFINSLRLTVLAMVVHVSGCIHIAGKGQPIDVDATTEKSPELLNHTPFPASLARAESEDGKPYQVAIIKVTLIPYADGSWRFDKVQEEITNGSVMSTDCPSAPDFINDVVAFRKKAEIYVRPNKNDGAKVTLKIGSAKFPLSFRNKCRVFDSPADVVLVPYLEDGTKMSVDGMNGSKTKRFVIPEGLAPFLIVRYQAGQVIFTPTRLDTVTLDTELDRAILVYRSAIPLLPEVRKVEFAAVLPKAMRKEPDPREGLRDEAIVKYLKSCPVPSSSSPVELCSLPKTPQNPKLFDLSRW